ncbi:MULTISPECIES: DUF1778 domain-containing protein [Photorhabdus]|uniref:DUF1778 domain-containing protein n=1 Tax=Photorhabdus thracensis TaxID=230089 RepID=A0A0F7LNY4_9GAMM|nr:DUF1778 domain-containing protein [Photorhabdus thracensis]AKH63748.1 hypothetical protein VY86_10785 [Photorhabdus thracensis]MCC8419778.1 DUF1778 domain-containing protein [Photorhabdus thracensis]
MVTARLDLRLDEEIKAKAEKASALLGMKSLTEYVVHLMQRDANQVISEYERMTIKGDIFDHFVNACKQAKKPNKALLNAVAFTKEQEVK